MNLESEVAPVFLRVRDIMEDSVPCNIFCWSSKRKEERNLVYYPFSSGQVSARKQGEVYGYLAKLVVGAELPR
jgi:hypothetical protein